MCFVNDCDWHASIWEETARKARTNGHCDECGAVIEAGEFIRSIYMQEHEECQACANGECDCPEDKCCACKKPEFGNTFDYDRCRQCDNFLRAVEAAELECGCSLAQSRPSLTAMCDEISNGGTSEAKRYWQKAIVMFPELAASGYLGKLWKRIFSRG